MAIWKGSPNYYPGRSQAITKIVIHWIVGDLESANIVFQRPERQASAHYGVENNTVYQWVRESDVAWHAGPNANPFSIGIENSAAPGRPASDATYNTLIALCSDICKRYGLNPDTAIEPHNKYMATQCPGTMDLNRIKNGVKSNQGVNMPSLTGLGDVTGMYLEFFGRNPYDYAAKKWIDPGAEGWVGKEWPLVWYGLKDSDEGKRVAKLRADRNKLLDELLAIDSGDKAKIAELNAKVADLDKKLSEAKDKYNSDPDTKVLNELAKRLKDRPE